MRLLFRASLFLLLIGFVMAMPLHAVTFTNWTGSGSAGLWTAAGNWDNSVPSTPDWVANVNVSGANGWPVIGGTVTLLTSGSVGGLQIGCYASGAGSVTINSTGFLQTDLLAVATNVGGIGQSVLDLAGGTVSHDHSVTGTGAADLYVGYNGGNGKLLMTGSSYLLINYNAFKIGCFGNSSYVTNGVVEMHDNATVDSSNAASPGQALEVGYCGVETLGNGGGGSATGAISLTDNATWNQTSDAWFGADAGGTGVLTVGGSSSHFNMSGTLYVGMWGGVGTVNVNGTGTISDSGAVNFGYQGGVGTMNVSAMGTYSSTSTADMSFGYQSSVGTLNVSGTGTFSKLSGGNVFFGNQSGSQGYLNVSGNGTYSAPYTQTLLGYQSGSGSMSIQDNANVSIGSIAIGCGHPGSSGTLTMTGGTLVLNPTATGYTVGDGILALGDAGGVGIANISGGNVTVYGRTIVGSFGPALIGLGGAPSQGVLTLSGTATMVTQNGHTNDYWGGIANDGWVIVGTEHFTDGWVGSPGQGTLTVTDNASLNVAAGSGLWFGGFGGTGTGVISGSATVTTDLAIAGNQHSMAIPGLLSQGYLTIKDQGVLNATQLWVATNGAIGQVNLLGGVCAFGTATGTAAGTVTINTGTIKALASNSNFITALTVFVNSGGAKIDTNGFNVGVQVPLREGNGGGGLTKIGLGTLTLASPNTYTGPTTVSKGGLAVGISGSLATTSITLAAGAGTDSTTLDLAEAATGIANPLSSLTLGSGSTLAMGLPHTPTVPGEIQITAGSGVLDLADGSGLVDVILRPVTSFGSGQYTLFKYKSLIGSLANLDVTVDPTYAFHIVGGPVILSDPGIAVTLVSDATTLTWNSQGFDSSDWSTTNTDHLWLDFSHNPANYSNLDTVTFDESTGATNRTINLVGAAARRYYGEQRCWRQQRLYLQRYGQYRRRRHNPHEERRRNPDHLQHRRQQLLRRRDRERRSRGVRP